MKSAIMNPGDRLFQIEIVEPRRRSGSRRLLFEGESVLKTGGQIIKLEDVLMPAPKRTLLKYFKDKTSAEKWGARFGTVIACFKVDKSGYLENIEHLLLTQEPLTVEFSNEGFSVDKDLNVSRTGKEFNIEIH